MGCTAIAVPGLRLQFWLSGAKQMLSEAGSDNIQNERGNMSFQWSP
jgi:hypothetical protein